MATVGTIAPARLVTTSVNTNRGSGLLGKHKPLRDGAEAKAVVTSVNLYQEGMRGNWGTGFTYDVGMGVHFDDHTTADIVRRIGGIAGTDLKFTVDDAVPVRYDLRNRDKIELDEDSLRAEQQHARESAQRSVDTHNERAVRDAEATCRNPPRGGSRAGRTGSGAPRAHGSGRSRTADGSRAG